MLYHKNEINLKLKNELMMDISFNRCKKLAQRRRLLLWYKNDNVITVYLFILTVEFYHQCFNIVSKVTLLLTASAYGMSKGILKILFAI